MLKFIIFISLIFILSGCDYNMALPASCGIEVIHNHLYERFCIEKDSVAPSFKLKNKDSHTSSSVFGHSNHSARGPEIQWIHGGENRIFDYQHHYFDASKNEISTVKFNGRNLIIRNGIFINVHDLTFGVYASPNFHTRTQDNNRILEKKKAIYIQMMILIATEN